MMNYRQALMEIANLVVANSGGRARLAFQEEVLIPVKSLGLTESYKVAGERLRQLGHEVYPQALHTQWDDLF